MRTEEANPGAELTSNGPAVPAVPSAATPTPAPQAPSLTIPASLLAMQMDRALLTPVKTLGAGQVWWWPKSHASSAWCCW